MGIRPPSHWLRRTGEAALVGAAAFSLAPVELGGRLQWMGVALVVAFLILSLTLHEAAHAWVADRCGDSTARQLGRLTINPIAHIDLWLTIIVPAMLASVGAPIFGGAKPVPVNYHNLRHPPRDMAMVAIAGPLTNFLLAILFFVAWKLAVLHGGYGPDSLMALVLYASMFANIYLAAFNVLPIPPLDGSRVMAWILPSSLRSGYVGLERFGLLLVIVAIYFVPPVQRAVLQMAFAMRDLIESMTSGIG